MSKQGKSLTRLEIIIFNIQIQPKLCEDFLIIFIEVKNNEESIYYIVPS